MSADPWAYRPAADLVGRELDLIAVQGRLQDPAVRLITLTGAGGVGKSRLAAEAALGAGELFPGGIHTLDLPACVDLESVLKSIGKTVRDMTDRTLLLLDGVEHVADALAVALAGHLTATPLLTVLATGQEILRIYGENVVPVTALPPPGPLLEPDVAEVQDNPAVRLFTRCAREASPDSPSPPRTSRRSSTSATWSRASRSSWSSPHAGCASTRRRSCAHGCGAAATAIFRGPSTCRRASVPSSRSPSGAAAA